METKRVEDPQTSAPDDLLLLLSWEVKQIHGCLSEVQKVWATRVGVTVSQWNILMAISHLAGDQGVRVNVVSEKLAVDASFVTAQSQLLESKGLICRRPSAIDRRVVLLALSSMAQSQVEELSGSMNAVNAYVANNARGKAHRLLTELEELKGILKRGASDGFGRAPPLASRSRHRMNFLSKLVVALLKPLYYRFAAAMLRDTTWQEPLFDLMSPKREERLLAFGPGSAATAISLAERFTELSIVVADPDPSIVRKSKRAIEKQQISNITFIDAPSMATLPVHTGCFDRAMCILSFHLRTPDEKIALAKEAFRILRRGGVFYVADYDRPTSREERIVLNIAAQISSRIAVQSHVDGTWGQLFKKAGFVGSKIQSSHSVRIGRVAMLSLRKPG